MSKNTITALIFLVVFGFSIQSCSKRRANRSTVTSQDFAMMENSFNDLFNVTEDALKDNDLEKSTSGLSAFGSNCATVTVTPPFPDTTFPKTVTIDFGTTNCTDNYGTERRGVIIATVSGYYRTPGTVISVTTQDYYHNDNKVEGTKTITNLGQNAAGNTHFSIEIDNGKVTYANGDITTYESSRIREWVLGEQTQGLLGILDDEYDITGTASGVNRNGVNYTMEITAPLRLAVICRWIKQGTLEIQPEDLHLRTVDFGNGDCDAAATVEINGNVYNITAP